jgi:cytochrome c oxidase subunit 1
MSRLVTADHKRLGLMYLASVMFFFLIAAILAIVR